MVAFRKCLGWRPGPSTRPPLSRYAPRRITFLRANKRSKDGKEHRYWSVVENRRVAGGRSVQKTLLYLGEINDSNRAAWTRAIEAIDARDHTRQIHLFPEDRTPDHRLEHPTLQLRLSSTQRELVAAIAETIIPKTDTPGATEASVAGWLELLVQDCLPAASQKIIVEGLAEVEQQGAILFQKAYAKPTVAEQIQLLTAMEHTAKQANDKQAFICQFKELTKFTYVNSEVGGTQAFDFVLERGRDVKHIKDYTTTNSAPWQLSHQNKPTQKMLADQSVQNRTGYTVTLETTEYFAKIIFLNASTVASTSILMHSKSSRFPEGIDESGSLGHNLMDHHLGVGADGILETHPDKTTYGRRPNGFYIPRFRNHSETANHNYRRGYGYQGSGLRQDWTREIDGFGVDFKKQLTSVGPWKVNMGGFGECLPYHDNRIFLHPAKKDKWGLPLVVANAEFRENETNMRLDMRADAVEMLEAMGAKDITSHNDTPAIGLGIHEMGTARMGDSPKNSVLNPWNQV